MTEIELLKNISLARQQQKELMIKNGDNSHELLSEGNYTDPQHFIFELLQNAEDESANKICFELQHENMVITHDSKHLFELGDIIAISNFGDKDSPKRKRENAIGRYGIGFKSVLAITEEPRIQSGIFDVTIKNRFIPVINNEDYNSEETKIILPLKKDDLYQVLFDKFSSVNGSEIIYLNNINELTVIIGKKSTTYKKIEKDNFLTISKDDEEIFSYLYLSKEIKVEEKKLTIKIVFGLEKNRIVSLSDPLNVFFPTKDETNLSFALHAPFKLATHTREHIDKDDINNKIILNELAILFIENLELLRDKGYLDVDFLNEIFPFRLDKKANRIYALFYEKCLEKLKNNAVLLPTNDNKFTSIQNCIFIGSRKLVELLSNEQLSSLFNRSDWVSDKITSNVRKDLYNFFRTNLQIQDVDLKYFLDKLNLDFLNKQSDEWLVAFYKTFCELKDNKEKSAFEISEIISEAQLRKLPIIRTTDNKHVLPENVFLPIDSPNISKLFPTVKRELLKDKIAEQFIIKLGIHKPSDKDEIRKIILEEDSLGKYFDIIFDYWKEERPQQIIEDIKSSGKAFIKAIGRKEYYKGSELYYPTLDLLAFFEPKPTTKFVDIDEYIGSQNEVDRETLKEFLIQIGVNELPRILKNKVTEENQFMRLKFHQHVLYSNCDKHNIYNFNIDGLRENIEYIEKNFDKEKSKITWHFLTKISIVLLLKIKFHYLENNRQRYYRLGYFDSDDICLIQKSKWLVTKSVKFGSPQDIIQNELANGYDTVSYPAKQLIELLKFKPLVILTKEQEKLKFLEDNKIDLDDLMKYKKWKDGQINPSLISSPSTTNPNNTTEQTKTSKLDKTIEDLDILQKEYDPKEKPTKTENQESDTPPIINFDEDEEFAKGIEDLKEQLKIKKSRVDLAVKINSCEKYSFDWFTAYLALLTTYGEKQDTTKQKSISFQEIKQYKADNKYFLLCGASSYISPEIENADDFKVSLVFGSGKKENIIVEGVSKKGQDLLIYCREGLANTTISRLSNIFKVEINFTPVIDLLDRLYSAFTNANYIDEWQNIEEAMPSLNYIYGPPGTGKTTTLCNNINSIIKENPNVKILVLTPTNKASDVVCKKLIEINSDIFAVRLSRPTDPELEEVAIYRDTIDEDDMQSINVVASTIHRLPYFDIKNVGLIFQYEWDYVIFDESSMTGLHYITFALMALFKSNPYTEFTIAGDPKQIPPVVEINDKELENFDFQDENIYKMMKLESFNPDEQVKRDIDTIENLETQYRSVPKIGHLFSELSYSGLLKHDRETNRKESKPLPEKIKNLISSNVTFIDIPLNQDNSIYKVNKLLYSSYQAYCAILVTEIVKYFDTINDKENWTIGLIAPYKAQAILINKLITSYGISERVKVFSDTVHGFQGDECDIVFFVCNPNNYYYTGHEKCLLSKEYIYNVAISRAKDYLVILYPCTKIQDNKNINKIGFSFKNNFGNARILNSKEVEIVLFNEETYIENNSFVSGHDNVNVFGLSEMKYFIKANDTAIDIQINKKA